MTLNFGASGVRTRWIHYHLGHLECQGKRFGKEYPSERAEHRLKDIESSIESTKNEIQILNNTTDNTNNQIAIISDEVRTLKNVTTQNKNDGIVSYFTAVATSNYGSTSANDYALPFPNVKSEENSGLDHSTGIVTSRIVIQSLTS